MTKLALLPGLLLALAAPLFAATPGDFASGMPLETPGREPFYRLALPFAVHAQARPDLADVRVFNAADEPVPYALQAAQLPTPRPTLAPLPFFPVRSAGATGVGSLDVKIEQHRDGRIVALKSRDGAAAGSRTVAYLLDLSAVRQPVQALLTDWAASADGYSAEARLESSDDLRHWRALALAPLLDMRFAGQQLQQKRIAFAPGRHRYLRLSADRTLPAFTSLRVEVVPARAAPPPAQRWHEVTGKAGDKPGEYIFELGAHLSATRVQLRLPELNTVAPVELLARARARDEWQAVARSTAYRILQNGAEIRSPALDIAPRAARYWLLRLDPRAGGIGAGAPVLRLAWTPQELVFLARGGAPFLLAYGQRDAAPAQLPLASLLPGYRPGREAALPEARPGAAIRLGGDNAPLPGREDQPPADWKRGLLWAVLLLGVALLALMARSLLRQMPARDH